MNQLLQSGLLGLGVVCNGTQVGAKIAPGARLRELALVEVIRLRKYLKVVDICIIVIGVFA